MSYDIWRFRCPECDSVQVSRITDTNHPAAKSDKRYRCEMCDGRFDRRRDAKTGKVVA